MNQPPLVSGFFMSKAKIPNGIFQRQATLERDPKAESEKQLSDSPHG
jgi:hypothetical protein